MSDGVQTLTLFSYIVITCLVLLFNRLPGEFANVVKQTGIVVFGPISMRDTPNIRNKQQMSLQNLRKGIVLLFILTGCVVTASSQERLLKFNITEFYQDQKDGAARSKEFQKIDGNGSPMAIIKVMSADASVAMDLNAFMFDFGNMRHETKVHGDELWVYVQKNARTVTIKREGYAPIKKHSLGTALKEGCTYVMKVSFDKVIQSTVYSLNKQMLQFKLEPALSGVLITLRKEGSDTSEELLTTDESGMASQSMVFGTYTYEIRTDKYLPSNGRIRLNTSETNHIEQVRLTPNFGYLAIEDPDNAAGAKIFVDDKEIGTVPYKSDVKWDCGESYSLRLVKDMYKPYITTFAIRRGETITLRPHMESNFAETTLTVNGNAEIWIDGMRKGSGRWAGPLKAGSYLVECRKPNHRPSQRRITVEVDIPSTIVLDPPEPITGFLSVMSRPNGASIKIDGKDYGVTPRNITDMLIGTHTIELSMPNRSTVTREVEIEEGKETTVNEELGSMSMIKFETVPGSAYVYINGNSQQSSTPFEVKLASGDYDIKVRRYGYREYHKRIHIDISRPLVSIKLHRQYMKRNSFYIEASGQAGATNAFGGSMGFYAGNVNIEGFYQIGLDKENIFWCHLPSGGNLSYSIPPHEEELKLARCTGGKAGYGFIVGTRMRFTPQIGVSYIALTGDETSTYALSGTAGLRMECALSSCLGISLTPEYSFKVIEADCFKALSGVSSTIKGWAEGFNGRIGLFLYL